MNARNGRWLALAAAIAGALVSALAFDPRAFAQAYLLAYLFWLQIALGGLGLLLLFACVRARWGAWLAPAAGRAAATLPLMALAFVPLALQRRLVYPWAAPPGFAATPHAAHQAVFFSAPFFFARAAVYFLIWIALARVVVRAPSAGAGATGLVLVAFSASFAAIDWAMSLTPGWQSTSFGLLFALGSLVVALAFLLANATNAYRDVTPGQRRDAATLLFALILVWAYVAYTQYLTLASANLPADARWYLARLHGGWQDWLAAVVALHLVVPFALLLSVAVKRSARAVAAVAGLVVVAHALDLVWTVQPAFAPHPRLGVLDAAAFALIGGLWLGVFLRPPARAGAAP